MRRIGMFFLVVVLLLNSLFFDHASVQAEPAAPADVPTALVGSGVGNYALVSPKLFWHTPVPPCPPADASGGGASPQATQYPETIKRIATYGSTVRTLYSVMRDCGQGQILSNLAADADYIYWLTAGGLVRLSTDANPGDAPNWSTPWSAAWGKWPSPATVFTSYMPAAPTRKLIMSGNPTASACTYTFPLRLQICRLMASMSISAPIPVT